MRSTSLAPPAVAEPQPTNQERRAPLPSKDTFISAVRAVLRTAAALEPDPVGAMAWYRSVPIAVLDGLTAAELVNEGRAHAVLAFLRAAIEIDRSEQRTLQ